jgi:hypothetical protein
MKEKFKDFYKYFLKYYLWFCLGVVTIKAIDLANYLMTYPSDITFFVGLFIYTVCIGVIGYSIYSMFNNLKEKKDEN